MKINGVRQEFRNKSGRLIIPPSVSFEVAERDRLLIGRHPRVANGKPVAGHYTSADLLRSEALVANLIDAIRRGSDKELDELAQRIFHPDPNREGVYLPARPSYRFTVTVPEEQWEPPYPPSLGRLLIVGGDIDLPEGAVMEVNINTFTHFIDNSGDVIADRGY